MKGLFWMLVLVGVIGGIWYFYFDPAGPTHGKLIQTVKDSGMTADDHALVRAQKLVGQMTNWSQQETNNAASGQ